MSESVSVSWHPNYSIHIDNMDGPAVYHLGEALKKYIRANDTDTEHLFNQVIEICEHITEIDDRD